MTPNQHRARSAVVAVIRMSLTAKLAAAGAATAGATLLLALLMVGWLALVVGQTNAAACSPTPAPTGRLRRDLVPRELTPLFDRAAARYRLGTQGPAVLAAVTKIESDFGRNLGRSSAGAIGWTQFLPSTWQTYGVDADGDGQRNPNTAADAIYATARYLHASGAPGDWRRAIFAYNHADWYVDKVLKQAAQYADQPSGTIEVEPPATAVCGPDAEVAALDGSRRIFGGGQIVPIPGFPGESIDRRLLPDIAFLVARFHIAITDGYAQGHKAHGEHPLGLGLDVVPGPGGSWDDIDRLAHFAEPQPNEPRPPWRWVGYTGDKGHGRGDHLHLSWNHSPTPTLRPPARWVQVLTGSAAR